MRDQALVLNALDRLYDASTSIDRWPAFLEVATSLFAARGSQIGHIDMVEQRLSFSVIHGYEWDEKYTRRYEALLPEDPRLPYFQQNPFKPVHCRMGISEEVLHQSRVYKEVLSVIGIEYAMGVNLVEERHSTTFFLVLRDRAMPPFSDADCALMGELVPHLNRAIKLQRDFAYLDFGKRMALETLEQISIGIVIADADGRVRFANRAGRELADAADGFRIAGGAVSASRREDRAALLMAVRRAVMAAQAGGTGQALALARPSGAEALSVLVSTLWGNHLRFGLSPIDEPLAVLFIADADHRRATDTELLQTLYGLTASEARLVACIVNGRPLKAAAAEVGLTEGSARQYLKIVFQKTGTDRQAELVRKILSSPLWMQRHN